MAQEEQTLVQKNPRCQERKDVQGPLLKITIYMFGAATAKSLNKSKHTQDVSTFPHAGSKLVGHLLIKKPLEDACGKEPFDSASASATKTGQTEQNHAYQKSRPPANSV